MKPALLRLHPAITSPDAALLYDPWAPGPPLQIMQLYAKGLQAAKDSLVHVFTR